MRRFFSETVALLFLVSFPLFAQTNTPTPGITLTSIPDITPCMPSNLSSSYNFNSGIQCWTVDGSSVWATGIGTTSLVMSAQGNDVLCVAFNNMSNTTQTCKIELNVVNPQNIVGSSYAVYALADQSLVLPSRFTGSLGAVAFNSSGSSSFETTRGVALPLTANTWATLIDNGAKNSGITTPNVVQIGVQFYNIAPHAQGNLYIADIAIASATPTQTVTRTPTTYISPTHTLVPVITSTPTITSTPMITSTPTVTSTTIIINTPGNTNTPWNTFTFTNTFTPTNTPTGTLSATPTPNAFPVSVINNYVGSPKLILAGTDSLTQSTYADYVDYFKDKIYAAYGYGGPGYFPCDNSNAGIYGYNYATDGVFFLNYTTPPGIYSLNGFGVSWVGANGSSYMMFQPTPSAQRTILGLKNYPQTYDYARCFYLKQPGGGSFVFNTSGSPYTNEILVNTNANIDIGMVELPGNPANNAVSCVTITGNVVLYGFEFYNQSGVMVNGIGVAGEGLYNQYSFLNAQTYAKHMSLLKPNYFLFNATRNDSSNSEPAGQLALSYNAFINKIKAGWPNCNILQIAANPAATDSTDLVYQYKNLIMIPLWMAGTAGYFDCESAVGNFAQETTWGYMGGNPHYSASGGVLIANAIFEKLRADTKPGAMWGAPWGADAYNLKSGDDIQKYVYQFPISVTGSQEIYEFGLASGGNQSVMVHLDIVSQLDGTSLTNKQSIDLTAQNTFATMGAISSYTTNTPVTVLQTTGANNSQLQMTFAYKINQWNRMEIDMVPSITGSPAPAGNGWIHTSIGGNWITVSNFTGATPTPPVLGGTFFQTQP